jgi:hypothetical protein
VGDAGVGDARVGDAGVGDARVGVVRRVKPSSCFCAIHTERPGRYVIAPRVRAASNRERRSRYTFQS